MYTFEIYIYIEYLFTFLNTTLVTCFARGQRPWMIHTRIWFTSNYDVRSTHQFVHCSQKAALATASLPLLPATLTTRVTFCGLLDLSVCRLWSQSDRHDG